MAKDKSPRRGAVKLELPTRVYDQLLARADGEGSGASGIAFMEFVEDVIAAGLRSPSRGRPGYEDVAVQGEFLAEIEKWADDENTDPEQAAMILMLRGMRAAKAPAEKRGNLADLGPPAPELEERVRLIERGLSMLISTIDNGCRDETGMSLQAHSEVKPIKGAQNFPLHLCRGLVQLNERLLEGRGK